MEAQDCMLKKRGHEVMQYIRSSVELDSMRFGKIRAFLTGLYNPSSVHDIERVVREFRPEVVHIHNLYPFISPAILPHIRKAGVPVVMTVHNYRLVCPNGLFHNQTGICERCAGGKEWNCIWFNCEKSVPKSVGYALRNAWARITGYYRENVDVFLCLTGFQKKKLVENSFEPGRCFVLPNFYRGKFDACYEKKAGNYVAFAGRLSREKGIGLLYDAARKLPDIPFKLAGAVNDQSLVDGKPDNVELAGMLKGERLETFYEKAAFFLLSSIWYEGFPMVILEAMNKGLPVLAPRLGGLPEIVDDGISGRLYESGNYEDLVKTISEVWGNSKNMLRMGKAAHEKLGKEYLPDIYYDKLISIYHLLKNESLIKNRGFADTDCS